MVGLFTLFLQLHHTTASQERKQGEPHSMRSVGCRNDSLWLAASIFKSQLKNLKSKGCTRAPVCVSSLCSTRALFALPAGQGQVIATRSYSSLRWNINSFRPGSDSLYVKTKTPNKFTRCMRLSNVKHKSSPLRCGPVGALPLHPHGHFSWNFQFVFRQPRQPTTATVDNQDPKDENGCPGPSSSSFSPSELSSPPQLMKIFQAKKQQIHGVSFRTYQCQGILQHPSGDV